MALAASNNKIHKFKLIWTTIWSTLKCETIFQVLSDKTSNFKWAVLCLWCIFNGLLHFSGALDGKVIHQVRKCTRNDHTSSTVIAIIIMRFMKYDLTLLSEYFQFHIATLHHFLFVFIIFFRNSRYFNMNTFFSVVQNVL